MQDFMWVLKSKVIAFMLHDIVMNASVLAEVYKINRLLLSSLIAHGT